MRVVVVLGREGVSVQIEDLFLDPDLKRSQPNARFVRGVGFYVVAVLAETVEVESGKTRLQKLPFRVETLQTEDRLDENSPVRTLELGFMYLIRRKKTGLFIQRFDGFNSRQYKALASDDEFVREACLVTTA